MEPTFETSLIEDAAIDPQVLIKKYDFWHKHIFATNSILARALPSDAIGITAKRLGILQGKTICLSDQQDMDVVVDYAIHHVRIDGKNTVQRM